MQAERLLTNVLNSYRRNDLKPQDIDLIFSNTISLLTSLTNPLNVTLLTSHLLIAPAIWNRPNGIATSYRIISLFNNAAISIRKDEPLSHSNINETLRLNRVGIESNEWVKAVVKGLDERGARWRHTLVIAGILLGMDGQNGRILSRKLRNNIENAMVTAINLALNQPGSSGIIAASSIVLALNHTFPVLRKDIQEKFDYNNLLPIMIRAMISMEGYQNGGFLSNIDTDLRRREENKLEWSSKSASFIHIQNLSKKPLFISMGPLSQLIAFAIKNVKSPFKVIEVRDHLLAFTGALLDRWIRVKFSEIDSSNQGLILTPATIHETLPLLWQVLKTIFFTLIVIFQAIIGRTLTDPLLSSNQHALITASRTLQMLKNIHFMTSRLGSTRFSVYAFVNLSSIDILSQHPPSVVSYLRSIYPPASGVIRRSCVKRSHDLFYLNLAEHFSAVLEPADAELLIIPVCTPYIELQENMEFTEIFEAAHSVMLSLFTAPQNSDLTVKSLPSYIEKLLTCFPNYLGPQQFRFAFKALIQICTPPNPLGTTQPMMAEALLEVLHHRALQASTIPIPSMLLKSSSENSKQNVLITEQTVFIFTILDSLPYLSVDILETWLDLVAGVLEKVPEGGMRDYCKKQFWETLENGVMDMDRSLICLSWWGSKGGREKIMFNGNVNNGPFMSGGLPLKNKSSRL
ncbi:Peroxisomal membrane protein PEX17 [Golovinomyces cichoracearum]|uniref:Peroxisomal membrane protein PEX17 n=1 Tax=Golovinomyces cichoracearum TaxID=62708 RepID=A0A420HKZ2_9PEZI|nr:Peroxisomal membrane protein PEX17 [Golovinomyces cichoracearum]